MPYGPHLLNAFVKPEPSLCLQQLLKYVVRSLPVRPSKTNQPGFRRRWPAVFLNFRTSILQHLGDPPLAAHLRDPSRHPRDISRAGHFAPSRLGIDESGYLCIEVQMGAHAATRQTDQGNGH